MPSFALSLASQISLLVQNLSVSNQNSVLYELSLLTEYGSGGSLLMLQSCLGQMNLKEGDAQNLQLKLDLLAIVIRHLVQQPNFSTIFCEAVKNFPFSEALLDSLSESLKLSLLEQISLGLALTNAEDLRWQHQGYRFCQTKITELCQTPCSINDNVVIDQILLFLHESEGLSKLIPAFVKSLPSDAHTSLMLMPLLQEEANDLDCLRFDTISKYTSPIPLDLMEQLENTVEVEDIMEELGYSCTVGVAQCKEILNLLPSLQEAHIARIIAMVSRSHSGLEDSHGTCGTFYSAITDSAFVDGIWASTWNIEVLVESIKLVAPETNWELVVDNFDHEGFYLPDQKAFNTLLGIYGRACEDPFPIEKVCTALWKNAEGQISFLRYAVLSSADVLQFKRAFSSQFTVENLPGTEVLPRGANHAWLSVPLLETLCWLAEIGHASAIRSILEYPLKHCPNILLLGIIQVKTTWNLIQHEILSSLFPVYLGVLNSGAMFRQLWLLNSEMVTRGLLEVHSKDSTSVAKILDICQEMQVLPQILESTPFAFSIDIAVSASRKYALNLEKWLFDNLTNHRNTFFQACLRYIKERALGDVHAGALRGSSQRSNHSATLPLEITATIFKVLQTAPSHSVSHDLLEEMKHMYTDAVRGNPRLLSVGTPDQTTSESFSSDIEEEANSYFSRIYSGDLSIENVVKMLIQFKESPVKRDQEVFACMIRCLFDEYRFFPKYPDRELRITAILFGSLIKHQLVSSLTLGIALRYVLDALRKPVDSRMFSFGLAALEKFRDRLVEWPQYCNHILQISHMREAHGSLVEFIQRALTRVSSESTTSHSVSQPEAQNSTVQVPASIPIVSTAESTEVSEAFTIGNSDPQQQLTLQLQHPQGQLLGLYDEKFKSSSMTALSYSKPFVSTSNAQLQHSVSTNQLFDAVNAQKVVQSSQPGTFQIAQSPGFSRSSTRPGGVRQGFGHALNIETLIAAAERRDIQIEAPSSEVQDKIAFIINNISSVNLETKAKEFMDVLKEQYYPWFAQYMVMKRASIEPNFHDTYLKFLDKVNSKLLHKEVVKTTYENCKVLLRSDLIKSSSEERSLLKNLGSWLGKLTIGRNQALRAIEIDPKLLIIEAYEKGLMIAVIPFTSKILEPCQSSLAYQPPNPWTMGILGLLAEIYNLPNLKMNIKFDIEVLFKNLGVDMKDVKVSQLLKGRVREIEGNPDFSNKDVTLHQPLFTTENSTVSAPSSMGHVDLPSEASVSASHAVIPSSSMSQVQLGSSHISAGLNVPEEEKLAVLALAERLPAGQGLPQTAGSAAPYSGNQLPTPLPNLSSYVVMNPKLAALGQQLQLTRIVPLAMERAIREIISPVVDRSVTIACMTTRELVTKDYAMEGDDSHIHHAGNLMVSSLAGSLAHVTCKEPLRVAMANHLRSLLQALNITGEMLEQAVLLVTNDNLDLGCAVIEKSATDKALHDLEEVIGPPLAHRRKQRESVGVSFYDVSVYSQGHLARLPEILRPKPIRLSAAQQRVYEDFARLPWQNQPSQTTIVAPSGSSVSSNIPASAGLARAGYTPSVQGLGAYAGMTGPQSAISMGVMNQNLDSSTDEIDHRLTPPLSHSSAVPVLVPDTGVHQALAATSGLGNLGSPTMFMETVTSTERQPIPKDVTPGMLVSASPPLPVDQVNMPSAEPSWTTGEAMEKFQSVIQKLDSAVSKGIPMGLSVPSQDQEVQSLIMEVADIISQSISKEEAAVAFSQKAFKRLYENANSTLYVATYLALLASIRDICKRVVKEITSWVMYADEERKYNKEIMVGLIRSELIHLAEYNVYLAKLIDGGRNNAAMDLAIYLIQTCVIQDNVVSAIELSNVVDALAKVAQRPGSSESLQHLVDLAKNSSSVAGGQSGSKEDKTRPSKERRPSSSRGSSLRDEGKAIGKESAAVDPPGLQEQVAILFDEWTTIWESSGAGNSDKTCAVYISKLQHSGMLKGDDITDRFFRILLELAVSHCSNLDGGVPGFQQQAVSFASIDMYAKLVVLLVKYYGVDPAMAKVNLLNKVLAVTVKVIQKVADEKKANFLPRPYFRLFVMWLMEFSAPDPLLDASNFQVLTAFANAFMQLQPLKVPGWSFAWLELVSHRMFMPKLLLINSQKGWPLVQRLLVALFKFMEPYLRNAELSDPVRLLYKGTLRVLLVLLHDFPEFLCDNHFSFCDVIPTSCIQMRNLILSAFPRNMRLPDPFTPNLKVDLLPEISQPPRILSDIEFSLKSKQLKSEIDEYLKTRQPISLLLTDLKQRLMLPQQEVISAGTRYNVPLIYALVLYVGMQAIQQLQSKTTPQQLAVPTAPITHSAPMDIFQRLVVDLDTEGRYLFLNAVANQLRYPNNHTHYFSCVLLYLFAEANQEIIQEQITRVLLERLIVNRPHPWGLLITFIELIKNPRYNFWSHAFTRCAPEIEKLFESVARSCMGPPIKSVEDDLASSIAAEGLKA